MSVVALFFVMLVGRVWGFDPHLYCASFAGQGIDVQYGLDINCISFVVEDGDNLCLADGDDLNGPPLMWTCKPTKLFK